VFLKLIVYATLSNARTGKARIRSDEQNNPTDNNVDNGAVIIVHDECTTKTEYINIHDGDDEARVLLCVEMAPPY
jgi:hypothetical protein